MNTDFLTQHHLLIVEIVIAIAFFFQKVELALAKKGGWLVGGLGGLLGIYYFFEVELYIYMIGNLGGILLSIYAYRYKDKGFLDWRDIAIRIVVGVVALIVGYFTFQGAVTVDEFVSIACFYVSPFFLFKYHNRLGWWAFLIAHMLGLYIGIVSGLEPYTYSQAASVLVCISFLMQSKEKINAYRIQ
jgi:hypothetical protein